MGALCGLWAHVVGKAVSARGCNERDLFPIWHTLRWVGVGQCGRHASGRTAPLHAKRASCSYPAGQLPNPLRYMRCERHSQHRF
eukprot:gene8869-biopygen310